MNFMITQSGLFTLENIQATFINKYYITYTIIANVFSHYAEQ